MAKVKWTSYKDVPTDHITKQMVSRTEDVDLYFLSPVHPVNNSDLMFGISIQKLWDQIQNNPALREGDLYVKTHESSDYYSYSSNPYPDGYVIVFNAEETDEELAERKRAYQHSEFNKYKAKLAKNAARKKKLEEEFELYQKLKAKYESSEEK